MNEKDFPCLNQIINNNKLIYVDNSATTQKPIIVINSIVEFYSKYNSNIHRSAHSLANIADSKYEEVRIKVSKFINSNKNEVVFTSGATASLNLLAKGIEDEVKKGDEIVLTIMEHHANLVPFQQLAKKKGAILKFIPINENFELDYLEAEKIITNKTKIVSMTHISNVLGTINNIEKIGKLAKKVGAYFFIDTTQSIPHLKFDFKKIDCDAIVFSSHKMVGPTGIGVLVGKYEFLEKLKPLNFGGDMIDEVFLNNSTFSKPPYKFEAGTPNLAGVIGFGTAITYLEKLNMKNIEKYEKELVEYFLEKTKNISNLKIIGKLNSNKRIGVFSFQIKGIHSHDLGVIFDKNGIATRGGHHCAMPLHNKLNLNSTTRISFYFYNTKKEIDKIVNIIKKVKSIYDEGKFLL